MNIIIVIFVLIFANQLSFGQDLLGKYKSDGLHITFNNNSAEFTFASEGCVIFIYKGCGKYEIIDDFLLIYTGKYCKEKSDYKKTGTNSDTITITILDSDNDFDIENYANVAFFDKSGNELYNLRPDNEGIVTFTKDSDIDYFYVLAAGYRQLKIKYEPKINYTVSMVNGEFVENETLAFHIDIHNDDTFELYQLGSIKKSKKNSLRQLKRAKRKREMHKKRYPYRIDKFVKE